MLTDEVRDIISVIPEIFLWFVYLSITFKLTSQSLRLLFRFNVAQAPEAFPVDLHMGAHGGQKVQNDKKCCKTL